MPHYDVKRIANEAGLTLEIIHNMSEISQYDLCVAYTAPTKYLEPKTAVIVGHRSSGKKRKRDVYIGIITLGTKDEFKEEMIKSKRVNIGDLERSLKMLEIWEAD